MMFFRTISAFLLALQVVSTVAANDLHHVLNYIIGDMKTSGFFEATWTTYFGADPIPPIPVPDCTLGERVDEANADESLTRVLDSGVIRAGIHATAADLPSLYSTVEDPYELTTNPEELDGYYVACLKEAVRLLNDLYESSDIALEVVLIEGDSWFEPLRDAVNDGTVDLVWSGVTINDDRASQVDFTCPAFKTDFVIGSGPGVGGEMPDANGDPVEVACTTIYCDQTIPAPFVMRDLGEAATVADLNNILVNATDGINYAMGTASQLAYFFKESCPTCGQVATPEEIGGGMTAPFVIMTANTDEEASQTETEEEETAAAGVCFHHGKVALTGALLALVALI